VSNPLDAPVTEHQDCIINVHVSHAAQGGWDVIATFEAYVLARQHFNDWHRAERAFRRMKAEAALNRYDELTRETIEALFAV
jgi:hypothetical protein